MAYEVLEQEWVRKFQREKFDLEGYGKASLSASFKSKGSFNHEEG